MRVKDLAWVESGLTVSFWFQYVLHAAALIVDRRRILTGRHWTSGEDRLDLVGVEHFAFEQSVGHRD